MAVNRINGTLFTGISALNGRTLSTLTAVNGLTITADVISGLILDWQADAGINVSDGSEIGTGNWLDQSSSANHPQNLAGSGKPIYRATGGPGGKPAVEFAGTASSFFDLLNSIAAGDYSIFVLAAPDDLSARTVVGGSGNNCFQYRTSASLQGALKQAAAGLGTSNLIYGTSGFNLMSVTWNNTSSAYAFRWGATGAGSGTAATTVSAAITRVGAVAGGGELFKGKIAFLRIYNRVLTSIEIQAVEAAMQARWGDHTLISTPSALSDIWEWWEPAREAGLNNGDPMSTLTGLKNGRNWTSSGSNRPTWDTTNHLNSLAVANMGSGSGTANIAFTSGPDMSALTAAHVFLLVKVDADPNATQAKTGLWNMGNNPGDAFPSTHYSWQADSRIYDAALRTVRVNVANPTPALTNWNCYEISSITNEWKVFLDGGQVGSTQTTSTVGLPSAPYLGQSRDTTYYMRGFIAHMALASAKLSSINRAHLVNYMNVRFNRSAL